MNEEKELTKEDLLALKNSPPHKVVVKGLGIVYVRVMGMDERDAYERNIYDETKLTYGKPRASLLARTICDSTGKRLFSDDPAEIESLGEINSPPMERIIDAARKLNKMTEKDLKDLEKNSVSDPQDVSS